MRTDRWIFPKGIETEKYIKLLDEKLLSIVDFLSIRDFVEGRDGSIADLYDLLCLSFIEFNNGSLCIRLEATRLKELSMRYLDKELALPEDLHDEWPDLFSNDPTEFKPFIIQKIASGNYLFFYTYWHCAGRLRDMLQDLAKETSSRKIPDTEIAIINATIYKQEHVLNNEQKIALLIAAAQRFSVISGGPGTGKTSIISALLQILVQTGYDVDDIELLAPTGRAAQRMTESIHSNLKAIKLNEKESELSKLKGKTIHLLLAYNPILNSFNHNKNNRLKARVLIVDEVSMLDVQLMVQLLSAVRDDCKIIFLGDKDQLPSVDAGAVLSDIIPSHFEMHFDENSRRLAKKMDLNLPRNSNTEAIHPLANKISILKISYRSDRHILQLAHAINNNDRDLEDIFSKKTGSVQFISSSKMKLKDLLNKWAVSKLIE
ncbi:MAG: AAA family ATPase, partial [Lentisphaeria bacterium]|nr:AAA family ATPase [Lentisphaeria bacterium]NQZ70434.1 AAA family ATPase [Lentisphaeria bacterium]